MPSYVLLTRLNTEALREITKNPSALVGVRQTLEQFEANILADYHLVGICAPTEIPILISGFNPPAVPFKERLKSLFQQPLILEFVVDVQY